MVMDQAFDKLGDSERFWRQRVLTSVVLVQTPLSMTGMASLLDKADLSPFHLVIPVFTFITIDKGYFFKTIS